METENERLQENANTTQPAKTKVGFPEQNKKSSNKSSRNLVTFLILVLFLLGGGAWYLFGTGGEDIPESTVTPTFEERQNTPTPTEVPEEVENSEIKIQVLNGSGIKGDAGDLQDELELLDYQDIEIGNASNQDNTKTTVSYSTSLSEKVKGEITKKLESLYDEVVVETKSMDEFDVMIITGYPKGHEVTATPKEESTPTPTEEPTPTS